MELSEVKNNPLQQGYKAASEGLGRDHCPYPDVQPFTDARGDWQRGWANFFGGPTLGSVVCRYADYSTPWLQKWLKSLGIPSDYRPHNRKHWEWCAIAQALWERGMLAPGRSGLGFAVGTEPLPAAFANLGASVVATDRPGDDLAWSASGQHAKTLEDLFKPDVVSADAFNRLVSFRPVDMMQIEDMPRGEFDFLWSSCAFEHLGTLERGLNFVKQSMELLKPGGVAVHTTEYNCSSNEATVTEGSGVIYRRRDLEQLAMELRYQRVLMEPFDFDAGSHPFDLDYDSPPFGNKPYHIKLDLDGYVSTSIMLVARKF